MRFYIAEREAFDALGASETLGDIVRIGFERVDFKGKDGTNYECYEMASDGKVQGSLYRDGEWTSTEIDADTPIDQCSILLDRDEEQRTIVLVKELA